MRLLGVLCMLVALGGCGVPKPDDQPPWRSDTKQIPTVTEPGVHISGYVNVGVRRRF